MSSAMAPTLFARLTNIGRRAGESTHMPCVAACSSSSHLAYFLIEAVHAPLLEPFTALALSILFTAFYVLPFYFSSTTRPSPTLSRDAPSVIRARIRFVSASVALATLSTAYLLHTRALSDYRTVLHTLGVYPINGLAALKALLLTACLFAGPIFEKALPEEGWRRWIRGTELHETLSSWIGWRNYVAGPLSEELLFRSVILALHTHTRPQLQPATLIFATPLYFGIAHIHHFYEFKLTHPYTPLVPAVLRSVIQFSYTTVFGWYATFIFLRTGSLWAVFLIHSLCNWAGLPRVWGRVEGIEVPERGFHSTIRGKEDNDSGAQPPTNRLGLIWTALYYLILVAGAFVWWQQLWTLTETDNALADLRPQKAAHKAGR